MSSADVSALHGSSLYEAATNALASDASSDNTFSKIALASLSFEQKDFERELRKVERLIKTEYKLGSMPNAWRSAKSIVLACMKHGIAIQDVNGELKGKTMLQTALRAKKTTKEWTALDHFRLFEKVWGTFTVEDRKNIAPHLQIMMSGYI